MSEIVELVGFLGRYGLLERVDPSVSECGLSDYKRLFESVREKRYDRVQTIGDDFVPDATLYNAVGAVYPLLNRQQRDEAIRAHLSQFDGINYAYVSANHTPLIREPLLLADIAIARRIYWPGLYDEQRIWQGRPSFAHVRHEVLQADGLFDPSKVKNDFLVAYALMRSDITSFGEEYLESANPTFLSRVLKGIVSLRFARGNTADDIARGRKRLYELLPESVHARIEPIRQMTDWADHRIF